MVVLTHIVALVGLAGVLWNWRDAVNATAKATALFSRIRLIAAQRALGHKAGGIAFCVQYFFFNRRNLSYI